MFNAKSGICESSVRSFVLRLKSDSGRVVTATFVQWPISPDVEFSNPNPSFVPKYDGYENFFLIFGQ